MVGNLARSVARRLGRRVVYGAPAIVALLSIPTAGLLRSLWLTMVATAALALLLAVTVRDVRANRVMLHDMREQLSHVRQAADAARSTASRIERVNDRVTTVNQRVNRVSSPTGKLSELKSRIVDLERELGEARALLVSSMVDSGALVGGHVDQVPSELAPTVGLSLLDRGDALAAYELLRGTGTLDRLTRGSLRRLRTALRQRGYLERALEVANEIDSPDGDERDAHMARRIEGEIAVMSGRFVPAIRREQPGFKSKRGRIMHLVTRSLPGDNAGYTFRTQYTAQAQRDAGLDPHMVTQMGVGHDGEDYLEEDVDGIPHHRVPGPPRTDEPLDSWLRKHVQRVANLVRVVRPAMLHAASDFLNALTAVVVGREFGIPVVYESRGFWEETWMSRKAQEYRWDLDQLATRYGLPDAYLWRREREEQWRHRADHVVTLDPIMAERIASSGVPTDRITVVPNGVAVESFPVVARNEALAGRFGIDSGTTVIGYVSSLVEYEGIDTLVSAYAEVRKTSAVPVRLLIVGDGPVRRDLERQAEAGELTDVIFTGRVPHDEVIDYYSLIDIFVVPRRPVEVCHLVTPLKPFEAFSTGRMVVLSNVRALAAIANQSGAAELFEAGDPRSLAAVLNALLGDPERRRKLAAAGADWVRSERTWSANAEKYTSLYERFGVHRLKDSIRLPRTAEDAEVGEMHEHLRRREAIPFEILSSADSRQNADDIIHQGWQVGPYPIVKLDLPLDWSILCAEDRSWQFSLHSWGFMGPVLRAFEETGERRYLDWCIERATSWANSFNDSDARASMAWYDMAVGLRGHRLAFLLEQAVIHEAGAEVTALLLRCVARHQQELVTDRVFKPGSNHGLYVALGALALSRRLAALPGMNLVSRQGRERLSTMTEGQFARDGGHLEHSPEYHRMVVATLSGALNAGLIEEQDVRDRVVRAEDVLGWFIQPNGELVQVGDSFARQMRSRQPRTASATTEFLVSKGRRGRPNQEHLLVLPDTGYAVVRSPQPTGVGDHEQASYLTLAAGFHSRAHKHADDLSITWFDRGSELLIDAGRYGYRELLPKESPLRDQGFFYGSPERMYVESTRAHNTVEADGVDHPRAGRVAYGSAIEAAEERDRHYRIVAFVAHDGWSHRREVVLRPGRWLYVVDDVASEDGAPRDYRVWWNLPEHLEPGIADGSLLAEPRAGSSSSLPLWIRELGEAHPISPVSGGRDPYRGWRSRKDLELTPAWSTGFEAIGVRSYTFRTLLQIGHLPASEFEASPFPIPSRQPAP